MTVGDTGLPAHRKPDLARPVRLREDFLRLPVEITSKCLIRGIVHDEPNRLAKERDVAFTVAAQARSLRQGRKRLLNEGDRWLGQIEVDPEPPPGSPGQPADRDLVRDGPLRLEAAPVSAAS